MVKIFLLILIISNFASAKMAVRCSSFFGEESNELTLNLELNLKTSAKKYTELIQQQLPGRFKIVRRGLYLPNYTQENLADFIFGDYKHVIASHALSRALNQSHQYPKNKEVLMQNLDQLENSITDEIKSQGYLQYISNQSRMTYLGRKLFEKTSATGMSSEVIETKDISKPMLTPTAFGYASTGFHQFSSRGEVSQQIPMLVLDIKQFVPHAVQYEYVIPSHIEPTSIDRVFLGFSDQHKLTENFDYSQPETQTWYQVTIDRDHSQNIVALKVRKLIQNTNGIDEWYTTTREVWSSEQLSSISNLDFIKDNPLVGPFLKQVLIHLSP